MTKLKVHSSNYSILLVTSMLSAFLLVSCSSSGLDREEAMKLIKNAKDYPKPVYKRYNVDDDGGYPLIKFLEKRGYLTGDKADNGRWIKTKKGENIIGLCSFYCKVKTYRKEISQIREVLIDEDNGTARVTYNVTTSPTSLYNEIRSDIGSYPEIYVAMGENGPDRGKTKTETREITLKKWDKGWHIAK